MEQVKFFAAKTLVLLDYLHQLKIVFRDLKTENIMIDQNTAEIKFVDFDLARCLDSAPLSPRVVTRFYRAPEVTLG